MIWGMLALPAEIGKNSSGVLAFAGSLCHPLEKPGVGT
jgi:hypothetical protein